MYSIVITASAEKAMRRFIISVKNRLTVAIFALSEDPRPAGCLKIKSEKGAYRIRVGDYRIAYTVDDQAKIVTVIRVRHRSDFYD